MKEAYKFLAKLELCRLQVIADPESVSRNPHLDDLLHRIYLRLCGGNIEDNAVGRVNGPEAQGIKPLMEEDQKSLPLEH